MTIEVKYFLGLLNNVFDIQNNSMFEMTYTA